MSDKFSRIGIVFSHPWSLSGNNEVLASGTIEGIVSGSFSQGEHFAISIESVINFNAVIMLVSDQGIDISIIAFGAFEFIESELGTEIIDGSVFAIFHALVIGAERVELFGQTTSVSGQVVSVIAGSASLVEGHAALEGLQIGVDVDADTLSEEGSLETTLSTGQVVSCVASVADIGEHIE